MKYSRVWQRMIEQRSMYLNSTLSFPTLPNTASAVIEEKINSTQNELDYRPKRNMQAHEP